MNLNAFKKVCQMTQKELKKYVGQQLTKTHSTIISADGFVYAQGEFPVLLVAHLDTVHKQCPTEIIYDTNTYTVYSPQGIGGDDRCGVYMIFEVIKKFNCSVLFCEDEEIGAVGAEKFINTKLARELIGTFNYIIEFDRKGSNDAVFYDCENSEFEEFITEEYYKYAWGSFSDISYVAPFLKCAAVNLSCGYYDAHTLKESVVIPDMEASIKAACNILGKTTEDDKFEYMEAPKRNKTYYFDDYYEYYDDKYYANYYLFEYMDKNKDVQWYDCTAANKEEAVGIFCMAHPEVSFRDIIDISVDVY